ncbi:MAG: hypothetical protein E6G24_08350 [Actinobacteria bacterium]|nr:MAG: hypothetical protein E6G24_08350 [Actinomycetota bacterium]
MTIRTFPVLGALILCSAAGATHGTAPRWCRARQPPSWHRVLASSVVSLSRRASVLPIAGAGDGRRFFAQLYSPDFSGVVRIDARTSRLTRIRRFPSARNDQADGSFDGRWFVWNEYHSLSDFFADFTTFAWDSRTGTLLQIGAAKKDLDGNFWASPWRQPDVRNGLATWTQGVGPDGETTEVHVYNLASRTDRIVRTGHAQGSFFVAGPIAVWPESLAPGGRTRMLAANPYTGEEVAAPGSLARLRGISALFTDGRTFAYPSAKFISLWWSPSTRTAPHRIFSAKPPNSYVDNSVRIAGRFVIFSSLGRGYVADTRLHRYVKIGGDPAAIDRKALIVSSWTHGKHLHPRNRIMFVPLRSLPPPGRC